MIEVQLISQVCLARVKLGQSLNAVLPQELGKIDSKADKAAIKNTVYGAVRHLGYLEFALDYLLVKRPNGLASLLLVGIYLIDYTRAANHAVVNAAVSAAKQMGFKKLSGLVNAVLRNYIRQNEEIKSAAARNDIATLQHQTWWIEKIRRVYPKQADAIFNISLSHPNLTLRINNRLISREKYLEKLDRKGMAWEIPKRILVNSCVILKKPVAVDRIPGFFEGLVSVQDAGAQISATLLDLQPNHTVLDACAAPGGKACHILELEDVSLTAIDKDAMRIIKVEENLTRLNLSAKTQSADGNNINTWWNGESYDRILLDAPCSASGVVRRHPDVKWIRREKDVESFVEQQRSLMLAMWRVLAKGGKLLYTTCSIFPEENEKQVQWFIKNQPGAIINSTYAPLSGHLLLPNENHDGFFHALFEKK